ncbi:hypothetical protein BBJ28_00012635 [Nothophytophthora sp. Chile5]|nr:hypothetical protein BBJ28_00012635 [Nothophytophthora sp. Chile5]
MVHSALSSLLAITALLNAHSLSGDYVNDVTRGEFVATAVSTGYFAYDLWDYVLNGLYVKSPGIVLHHAVVLICYISALTKTVGVPLLSLALVCELHSVFMHWRKLLVMSEYSMRQSLALRWVWRAQWGAFVAARIVPHVVVTHIAETSFAHNSIRQVGGKASAVQLRAAGAMTMKGAKTDEWFSPEELEAAREEYLQEQEKEQPSSQVPTSNHRPDGGWRFRWCDHAVSWRYAPKECLYWIALTLCGLGEYRASRSYCERLLRMEPTHKSAQLLHKRIKEVVAKGMGGRLTSLGCRLLGWLINV